MSTSSHSQSNASPSASDSTETPHAVEPELEYIPQGKAVTRALAIVLDEACLTRWGTAICDELRLVEPGEMTPEQLRSFLVSMRVGITRRMAYEAYCKIPGLPRFERNVLAMDYPDSVTTTWLLILKDNSSYEALHAPLEKEDVRALKEFLGVRPQRAKWYDVSGPRRLCGRAD
ncbi:hypothetical protein FKP32DRAFT_1685752 [Trametes sanguinea]|nr:hypothetical protein FKP32DRAFT_1685752 [Trametes sanguinea]